MASTEMPTLAIELLTEPLPLPSSPPPPPDFAGFPEDVEPPIESILSEKIRIGSRLLKVQGFRLASSRPVYRMSHHATTSDWLYVFGGYRSGWWKLLDWARGCYPQWFLPRDFVFKVYGPSPDRKDMGPKARASLEFEAYKRLSTRQGRNVPKCYGVVLFQYQAALLLQHIDGVTLGEWHASSDRVATNVKPPDMTANEPLVDRRRRESQLFLSSGQQREECEQSGELETMHEEITELVRMLNCYGVKGDLKVDNFIYGNKSLWIIDFDLAKHDDPYLVTAENDWGLQRLLKTLRSYTGSVVGVRILPHLFSALPYSLVYPAGCAHVLAPAKFSQKCFPSNHWKLRSDPAMLFAGGLVAKALLIPSLINMKKA
ncbi:MAG: hypothetical protein LQ346_005216 [Caloplaca aetnensis]|nr:MAG: hypothetical protein LQ346_005216 [Caloplaca aetnensis]